MSVYINIFHHIRRCNSLYISPIYTNLLLFLIFRILFMFTYAIQGTVIISNADIDTFIINKRQQD